MFSRKNFVRLMLVTLILALLAIPVLGAVVGSVVTANGTNATLVFHAHHGDNAGVAIACDDPGGGQGGGC